MLSSVDSDVEYLIKSIALFSAMQFIIFDLEHGYLQ